VPAVEVAEFDLDVAPGGRAALVWEQDGTIVVQELNRGASEWGPQQVVARGQDGEPYKSMFGNAVNPEVTAIDVATGARGAVAVGWLAGKAFPDESYRLSLRRRSGGWPLPTSRFDPTPTALDTASYWPDGVSVELDGRDNAVAVFTHGGGSGGEGNPILAATASAAGRWSALQDLGRFFGCDTFLPPDGPPSIDGSAGKGVLVAWACTREGGGGGPGIVVARTFR
jgi:hypothetical protein